MVAAAGNNWSNLQSELIELVLKRLEMMDIIRSKAVCRNWNIAAQSYTSSPSYTHWPQIPLLIASPPRFVKDENFHCRLVSLAENRKVYNLNHAIQQLPNGHLVSLGSSYGWLAVWDIHSHISYLINPFSGVQIEFGSGITHPISKIVLSSDPSRSSNNNNNNNNNFSAAVLYDMSHTYAYYGTKGDRYLAFYKHRIGDGDTSHEWTWTKMENQLYLDIICHNGRIYALSCRYTVDIWNFHDTKPVKVIDIENLDLAVDAIQLLSNIASRWNITWMYRLVESLGEILIVKQISVFEGYWSTFGFFVFKLDDQAENGCTSLPNLKDRALFIGDNEATSISTKDFPELQDNSIYFKDDNILGIYNLEKGKITSRHGLQEDHRMINFWMVPNPW